MIPLLSIPCILNGREHEPVEQGRLEIPSVDLVTELVQVVLQVPVPNLVVDAQQVTLGVADYGVHPRQRRGGLLGHHPTQQ